MAVPQFNGNAFTQALNGMNNVFGGLQANRQAAIVNQYLPQQLQLANQGQDISNQTGQLNLDTNKQLSPIQVALAQLGLSTDQQLSPIKIQQAQAALQGSENQNAMFPLNQQNQQLQNKYLQTQINSANNPLGTGNMRPGQPIIDPQTGQIIGYTPTTQAMGQAQQMNAARQEANALHTEITAGLSPYQGIIGQGRYATDLSMYKSGMASDETKERLIKYAAAVAMAPTFIAASGRAATGGVPSSSEMEAMRKSYGFPESGVGFGGLSPKDFERAQEYVRQAQQTAGNASVNTAVNPVSTAQQAPSVNEHQNAAAEALKKRRGDKK